MLFLSLCLLHSSGGGRGGRAWGSKICLHSTCSPIQPPFATAESSKMPLDFFYNRRCSPILSPSNPTAIPCFQVDHTSCRALSTNILNKHIRTAMVKALGSRPLFHGQASHCLNGTWVDDGRRIPGAAPLFARSMSSLPVLWAYEWAVYINSQWMTLAPRCPRAGLVHFISSLVVDKDYQDLMTTRCLLSPGMSCRRKHPGSRCSTICHALVPSARDGTSATISMEPQVDGCAP